MDINDYCVLCHKKEIKEVLTKRIKIQKNKISATIHERHKHWYYSGKPSIIYYTELSRQLGLIISHIILNVDLTAKFIIESMSISKINKDHRLDDINHAEALIKDYELDKNQKVKKANIQINLCTTPKNIMIVSIRFIYIENKLYRRIRGGDSRIENLKNKTDTKTEEINNPREDTLVSDGLVNPAFTDHYQDHVPAIFILELLIEKIGEKESNRATSIIMEFKKFLEKNIIINFNTKESSDKNIKKYAFIQNACSCVEITTTYDGVIIK
ncbi:hypothetical protein [Klebsiella pneumoniae]